MKEVSGIYTITNIVNGKLYVGMASVIKHRWLNHKKQLNLNIHKNPRLQHSWNKYGEDSFLFEVLEYCDEEYLYSMEHWWCNMLDVHRVGYNIQPTHPYRRTGQKRAVVVIDIKSQQAKKFSDLVSASEYIGVRDSYLTTLVDKATKCAIGKYMVVSTEKYIEGKEYKKKKKEYSLESIEKRRASMTGRKRSDEVKRNQSIINRNCPIVAIKIDNSWVKEYDSPVSASEEIGITRQHISSVLRGKISSASGYTFIRKENYIPSMKIEVPINNTKRYIGKFSLDGVLLQKYKSQVEAYTSVNGNKNSINKVLLHYQTGKYKNEQYKNYIWKYLEYYI